MMMVLSLTAAWLGLRVNRLWIKLGGKMVKWWRRRRSHERNRRFCIESPEKENFLFISKAVQRKRTRRQKTN